MPPRSRVTRQMVAEASFRLVRESGHEALNARAIARRLGCSTQPVLYSFRTVDEIRRSAYALADEFHTAYLLSGGAEKDPLLALGLNYVRFGHEEKNLFRFLFQTDEFGGKDVSALISAPELGGVLDVTAGALGADRARTEEAFLCFFCAAHGLASLLANNSMAYDEAQCRAMLVNIFRSVTQKGEKR